MHITLSVLSSQKEIRNRPKYSLIKRFQLHDFSICRSANNNNNKTQGFLNNTYFVPHKLCITCQRISGEFHENSQNDTEWILHCLKWQNYFLITVEKQEGFVFHQLRCLAPTLPAESMKNHTMLRFWIINWKKRILIKSPHTLHVFRTF